MMGDGTGIWFVSGVSRIHHGDTETRRNTEKEKSAKRSHSYVRRTFGQGHDCLRRFSPCSSVSPCLRGEINSLTAIPDGVR